ncbi:uncharacterized protein LOC110719987 [Chenopodium quinoa]|uniref:Uncharacterized protein n=1 Tax=Chenopodium quinoa TaxID=63459 RepID=A0A803MTI4_CHEQI|nr:uncharacterized protein LOC110719987 [Chenopodium quinoa]
MTVALPRCAVFTPTFQIKYQSASPFQPQTFKLTRNSHWKNISYNPSTRKVVAQFELPDKSKMQMKGFKEQLWKSLPDSVKEFPWKKAEHQVLHRLLFLGLEAFKWSFMAWFFLSFVSDVVVTISRNQELVMPLGLFAGCLLSDFMKETFEEMFQQREVKGIKLNFLGIACAFVVLKLISTNFASRPWIFLLHVANGGLLQIVWLWKTFREENVKAQ